MNEKSQALNDGFKSELMFLTKPLHDRIEMTPIAKLMAEGKVSPEHYAHYLNILLGIHTALETKALTFKDKWKKYGISIEKRCRTSLLKRDLALLNYDINIQNILPCNNWSFAKVVGGMYVLEGSTMGGQILSKRLDYLKAIHYFEGYGKNTMKNWEDFSLFINNYAQENPEQHTQIVNGATTLYETVEKGMKSIII